MAVAGMAAKVTTPPLALSSTATPMRTSSRNELEAANPEPPARRGGPDEEPQGL